MSDAHPIDFRCPNCRKLSGTVLGMEQAICTNDTPGECTVIFFNPSIPGGGTEIDVLDFDCDPI